MCSQVIIQRGSYSHRVFNACKCDSLTALALNQVTNQTRDQIKCAKDLKVLISKI